MEDKVNKYSLAVFDRLSKGNQFVFYIYQKISKLSVASYLVTDLIKDIEPMKWQIRKMVAEMVSLRHFFDERSVFNALEQYLLELEGLLELGKSVHVISNMNAIILQAEINKLLGEIRDRAKDGFYAPELVPAFFEVPKPTGISMGDLFPNDKGHKGQSVLYTRPLTPERSDAGRGHKSGLPSKGQRKDEILLLIKLKGSVTIKDITEAIKDCSEKTIQRELLSMVDQGLLKKTGERRWSRYSV